MKIRFVLLLVVLIISIASPATAVFQPGNKAPDFSGQTLDEQQISISELKGKVLLIEMGTTWCPSCNELAQQINELRNFLKSNKVTFVSVYLADSADSIRAHNKDKNLEPADVTIIDRGEARRNYSVFTIPRLLLIDKDFEIVFDVLTMNGKEIQKRVNKLLTK